MKGRRSSRSAAVVLAGCVGLAVIAPGLALAAPVDGLTKAQCTPDVGVWDPLTETCEELATENTGGTGSGGTGSEGTGTEGTGTGTGTEGTGTGTEGTGTGTGTGTEGTGTGTAGTGTGTGTEGTGTGTEGTGTGTEGTGTEGTGTEGTGTEGTGTEGTGTEGTGTEGTGTEGTGTEGTGTEGTGTEGTGTEGTGTEGTGTEGTGTEGTGTEGTGTEGTATEGTGTEGTGTDGTATDGTATDGTATDGTATDGTATDGTGSEGSDVSEDDVKNAVPNVQEEIDNLLPGTDKIGLPNLPTIPQPVDGKFTNVNDACLNAISQLKFPAGTSGLGKLSNQLQGFCRDLNTTDVHVCLEHLRDVVKHLCPTVIEYNTTINFVNTHVSYEWWGAYWHHRYDVDCDELTYDEANAILDWDRSDPFRLDRDDDGEACEANAHGNDVETVVYDSYPVGGVATGDGSTDSGASGVEVALAAGALGGLGVTGLTLARRFARQG